MVTIQFQQQHIGIYKLIDIFKQLHLDEIFIDQVYDLFNNYYWLLIMVLHVIFDYCTVKYDIQFWLHKQPGLYISKYSLLLNIVIQIIILLYLIDNNVSNYLLLSSNFISLIITLWKTKLTFLTKKKQDQSPQISLIKEADDFSFQLILYSIIPMLFSSLIYQYFYYTHKNHYSWILSSITSILYLIGFIRMLPQLYINYKLKSVAHISWQVLMYKAFNTFIDDVYMFLLPNIPLASRLAVFRDDFIFMVYLIQRYYYHKPKGADKMKVE